MCAEKSEGREPRAACSKEGDLRGLFLKVENNCRVSLRSTVTPSGLGNFTKMLALSCLLRSPFRIGKHVTFMEKTPPRYTRPRLSGIWKSQSQQHLRAEAGPAKGRLPPGPHSHPSAFLGPLLS